MHTIIVVSILKKYAPLGLLLLISVSFLVIPLVAAHAPLGSGDNESINTATVIPDPTKSWALYNSLNSDGDPQYYTFEISQGQNIHVTMYKSMRNQDDAFTPQLVIIGPNITANGEVPSKITVPSNSTAMIVPQTSPTPTYEPFSPGTYVGLADYTLDNPASGRYWLVVYEQSDSPKGGNYGLAVGDRETYTIDEWLLIPFNLISIYQWEGQSLALILAPMIIAIIAGVLFTGWVLRHQRRLGSPLSWLAAIAGFTFIGTAASTFMQLIIDTTLVNGGAEVVITLIFALIPLLLGLLTVRLALQDKPVTRRRRIYLVVLGVAALFIWAGYIVGPALAVAASVMPALLHRGRH
jgi:hypothetical protein